MKSKKETVLNELLESLTTKTFDLEAWKIKARLIVKKVFGPNDEKLELINALHYDYSSWSLRDETGKQQSDSIKEQARGIIEAAILELSLIDNVDIIEILKIRLSTQEWAELQELLAETTDDKSAVTKYFSKIAAGLKDEVLAEMVFGSLK